MPNKLRVAAALALGGILWWKLSEKTRGSALNASVEVEESIEVASPVSTAYKQWARFEDYPKFMSGVHEVQQLDDRHLQWRADVGGKEEKWDAEIVEQIPYMRIAWRSVSGGRNAGVVRFQKISDTATKVLLQTDCDSRSFNEQGRDALGLVRTQARNTLSNFKDLLERREK